MTDRAVTPPAGEPGTADIRRRVAKTQPASTGGGTALATAQSVAQREGSTGGGQATNADEAKTSNPVRQVPRGERIASANSDSPPPIRHFGLSLKVARPSWSDGYAPSDPEPANDLRKRLWSERGKYLAAYDEGAAAISALLSKINTKAARHHKRVRLIQGKSDRAEAKKYAEAMGAVRLACAAQGVLPSQLAEIAEAISRGGANALLGSAPVQAKTDATPVPRSGGETR